MAEQQEGVMDADPSPPDAEQPVEPRPEWGEDITPEKDGGLFKTVLQPGTGDDGPLKNDEVFVHYTGRLLSGEVFDSSLERGEPFKFKLGAGKVIKGWDVGVATMKAGEKSVLTCLPNYGYGAKGSPPKIPGNSVLQFEVELLSWEGEDISKDGGVRKSTISEGKDYSRPSDGSQCNVHIRGRHGSHVFEERDVSFVYGEGTEEGLLRGVELAIGQMKCEETAKITVQPKYGFGEQGNEELGVPASATLVYEVRLNSFQKPKQSWEYDDIEERKTDAEKLKERGTNYFKEGKWALAHKLYERGADLISDSSLHKDEEKEVVKSLRVALHLNQAACHLKLNEPSLALKECGEVIQLDGTNVKAFFRQGQARQLLQDYEEAIGDYQEVLKLEPENKAAQRQLALSKKKLKVEREKEKKRYANMFRYLGEADENEQREPGETDSTKPQEEDVPATDNQEDPPAALSTETEVR